ncbi:hypothetical protein HYC85_019556 [Camellia sinensis]|uniref:Uncharacterized protein n=1 Tax=Camellia sinensis TaxID=4442 RepID=A0A7J7GR58_CAMSI|nr:hypothetical protein HYC85_019556 [Camellia sinensis]
MTFGSILQQEIPFNTRFNQSSSTLPFIPRNSKASKLSRRNFVREVPPLPFLISIGKLSHCRNNTHKNCCEDEYIEGCQHSAECATDSLVPQACVQGVNNLEN